MSLRRQRKDGLDEAPPEKRRKIGSASAVAQRSVGQGRQPLVTVTNRQEFPGVPDPVNTEDAECDSVEFSKEEVQLLLQQKLKTKQFDLREKTRQTNECIKKLKLCIEWFRKRDESHLLEHERFQNSLESAERKLLDAELELKTKVDEFSSIILDLRGAVASLQEKFTKEESDKLDVIECHKKETQARVAAEKFQISLSEEVAKAWQENMSANQKITSLTDMYKQLQEYNTSLQHYNSRLQTDLAMGNESLKRVEQDKLAIMENLSTIRANNNMLQEQLSSSRDSQNEATMQKESLLHEVKCLRGELQQVRDDRNQLGQQLQALTSDFMKFKESTGKSFVELDNLAVKSNALEETCSSQRNQIHLLEHQLAAANEKLKMVDMSASEAMTQYEEQRRTARELQDQLADADLQISVGEKLRKKLHNTILELKGNIRVFCRVRPLLADDCDGMETPVVSYPTSTEAADRSLDLQHNGQKYPFMFDKVFSHEASQQDVFVEISQLVQSALDGYKVCIFAYGQTGSGKTYTMMGEPEVPEQKGLIPRSLEQVFQTSQSLSSQGWKYKMQASMLEIYNETIRDLLSSRRSSNLGPTHSENGIPVKQYTIKHDASGNTHVSDLTIVDVCSINEISSLLHRAALSRSVGKTHMNEHSSRSHFVFTLRISGLNEGTEQQVQGVLNLIDLAGSERLSRSGATGGRLKETQAINKSLSSLSDVIFALAKKEDHVPYRNSKLTYLLQPCLGGDSKTLMVVNISPDQASGSESLCSLRFAARVNACEIGVPRRHASARFAESRLSYG